MDSLRAWLCPTPWHRLRVAEAGARTRKVRIVAVGAIGVGVLGAAPWTGWWMLALFVPSAIHLITVERWMARSASPELVPFLTLVTMLFLLAGSAAGTGGPSSPVLPWLAIVPAIAALRFRMAVCVAMAGVAGVLILAVGFGTDPAQAAHDPLTIIAALVMLVNVVAVCTALMSGELEHRDGAVALVLLDLDRFKRVNDEHGHERGDAVLRDTAYQIRKALRSFELVYRLGGEEFLLLLPGADLDGGIEIAERVREAVAVARPGDVEITLSAGVATAAGEEVRYDALFRAADLALLRAKREGRDQVVAAAEPRAVVAA